MKIITNARAQARNAPAARYLLLIGLLLFVFPVQTVAAEEPSRQILNAWLDKQSQTKSMS